MMTRPNPPITPSPKERGKNRPRFWEKEKKQGKSDNANP
jgi:hypothetical protein